MNILVNFATLKTGGGQNVGLNFIYNLQKLQLRDITFYFVAAQGTNIHKYLDIHYNKHYIIFPINPLVRIIYEIIYGNKIVKEYKIDIIYSYFGYGLYPKRILQVIGSAESNIFFPNIDFWVGHKGFSLLKKKIVDKYRIWGVKRASGVIFENSLMEKRSHQLFGLVQEKTIFIKPSINFNIQNQLYTFPKDISTCTPKGLFLCSWQLNKNIMIIPELAHFLKNINVNFHFVITTTENYSVYHKKFKSLVIQHNVSEMISIIGEVKKEQLASLYNQIDFVFLLSKLESFSNNIIEAFYFSKPLIISDEPWARAICRDAAIYVDRDSVEDIAFKLINLINNNKLRDEILVNGKNELEKYPSIDEKIIQEVAFLKHIYSQYSDKHKKHIN